jgi:hypothetical protein
MASLTGASATTSICGSDRSGGKGREELIVTVVGLMALLGAGCGQKLYMRRQDPVRERDD